MRQPLQEWISKTVVADEMIWKGAWGSQMRFMRDALMPLARGGMTKDAYKAAGDNIAWVISTHTSKSISLPVLELDRSDIGLRLIFRDNFYNWKMSVISEKPITVDFAGLFHTTPPIDPAYTGNPLAPVYFEGFPKDLIFGYYEPSDKMKWSCEIWEGQRAVWTSVFLMMRSLGQIKGFTWHTQESHKKELEANR